MLSYFYASPHLVLTNDNAFDVLAAAHYLGATAVQGACVEYLSQVCSRAGPHPERRGAGGGRRTARLVHAQACTCPALSTAHVHRSGRK